MVKSLLECKIGEKMRICRIDGPESVFREFFLLGLREGSLLEVLQIKPMFVLKTAYTEIAVEQRLAALLWGEVCRKN
ncbi:MAG: FeoA family protein [Sporomusaceae bacterium]|nr:FeoA family protein [Sporomusaceae bacterium]